MNHGIAAFGAYLPRWRLQRSAIAASLAWLAQGPTRARGERSYCNWDEDALTMAVEAGRACLASRPGATPAALWLASTSLPFADRSNSGLLAGALDLTPPCRTLDSSGSLRAATGALVAALEGRQAQLVVGSDARKARPASGQEMNFGHGAAAILTGTADLLADFLGAESVATDLVDHYRGGDAEFDYALEERWVRDEGYAKLVPATVGALLHRLSITAAAIDRMIVPVATAHARRIATECGIRADARVDPLHEHCGDTGTAHPLLMLTAALESARPGELVLLVGFGQGVDALLFRTTPGVATRPAGGGVRASLAAGQADGAYTRYLSHQGLLDVDPGMRAERDARTAQSAAYRKRRDLTAFIGGRCTACGTVQFPKALGCVNPECRAFDTQVDERLADVVGRVKSFTEDWLAYTPSPPLPYGNVDIGRGGNIFMEFTDIAPGELAVGLAVRMVYRIKDVDRVRQFHRYFWKATPVRA